MPRHQVAVALVGVLLSINGNAAAVENTGQQTLRSLLEETGVPGWILSLDASIEFEASEVRTEDLTIQDVELPVRIEEHKIVIDGGKLRALDGDLSFDLQIDAPSNSFNATVRAQNIEIGNAKSADTKTITPSTAPVFSATEILPTWLAGIDGRVDFDISNIQINDSAFRRLQGQLIFAQKTLKGTLSSDLQPGRLTIDLAHDYPDSHTQIKANGSALPLHLMPATREYLLDTVLSFELEVDGQGRSARELAETLNGQVTIEAMHGNLNVENLEKLTQDILSLTLTSVVPIPIGRKITKLECGMLKFAIKDGVANSDNAIAIRTDNLAVIGGGKIDFANETLDIRLHPHARSKHTINTKSAVKEVKLSGPLRDIQVTPQLGGIINQGISLTTKIAALGLSKLRLPLLDWAAPPDVACMSSLATPMPRIKTN